MRYYPGLGVGHKYGWLEKSASNDDMPSSPQAYNFEEEQEVEVPSEGQKADVTHEDIDDDVSINSMDRGSDASEAESDVEGVEVTATGATEANEIESEDEEVCAHHEMYDSDGQ